MNLFSTLLPLTGFATALAGTLALTPVARYFARWIGVVDCPDGWRKLQRRPVALLGGVAVLAGFMLGIGMLLATVELPTYSTRLPGLLTGMAILCLIGVYDDKWSMPARWKLVGQIIAAVPVMLSGFAIERIGIRSYVLELGWGTVPFTVLWLVVAINSVNLIDGMDGLCSTTAMCVALGVAATGWVTGTSETTMLALTLVGALAGFLVYNFPPATIYLGDAGSMVIGMALAVLSLEVAQDLHVQTSLPVMLVLMAVPLGDTGLAILRRWLNGKGIFYADRGHIHHRLLDQGFGVKAVLAIVGGICLLTGAVVVLARAVEIDGAAWVACIILGAALVRVRLMGYHEWALVREVFAKRFAPQPEEAPSIIAETPVPILRLYVGDSTELEAETAEIPAVVAPPKQRAA